MSRFLENRYAQDNILQTQKELSKYIYQMGGKDVVVTFDKEPAFNGYRQYSILYKDSYGIQRSTRCRVHGSRRSRAIRLGKLYLPIFPKREPIAISRSKEALPAFTIPTLSSKEQIISDLTAENRRLQAELEKLRQQNE